MKKNDFSSVITAGYLQVNLRRILSKFCALFLLSLVTHPFCYAQSPLAQVTLSNQLNNSPSPYLVLHAHDPVAWQAWSPATLQLAREQNKLLFVSIGYFSCHWCHVMQAESYQNKEIAALINQYFIPVKVDRELEVALDAEMIAFAQGSIGSAGWPLNVFITPEGYPLYATLYDKPDSFGAKLAKLGKAWLADGEALKAIAQNPGRTTPLVKKTIKPTAALAKRLRSQLVVETLTHADFLSGGLSVSRKFPIAPQLLALLEAESHLHNDKLAEWLRLTLDQMANGGMRDHVAGGFFRYTTDPNWRIPHFEKMLYDNALLALVYLRAAKLFKDQGYREIAIETLDFMLADMRQNGAFVTSISALDDKGREGGAYLWTEEELKTLLAPNEFQLVSKAWQMDTPSEFAYGYLPIKLQAVTAAEARSLKQIYTKLSPIRKLRTTPKDTKQLSGLNGLVLAAYIEAASLAPQYREAAMVLRQFILDNWWKQGVLSKGVSSHQLLKEGDLESYAYTSYGLMRYAQFGGDKSDANTTNSIAKLAWEKFHTNNGFVLEQGTGLAKPYYYRVVEDGPLPSPSSLLIITSLQSNNPELRKRAINALADGEALQQQGLFWYATQISAMSLLLDKNTKSAP